jgi:very-short-patch-repair endonuclease
VRALVRREGVVARRQHPGLVGCIDGMARSGHLVPVLPGVYRAAEQEPSFPVRVAALQAWCPDAVLVRGSAARLTFMPEGVVSDVVEAAVPRRGSHRGYSLVTRKVPEELVVHRGPLRLTTPALTALDLCEGGADVIDVVLRSRAASLSDLWRAFELTRGRRGNHARMVHLLDSKSEPWSAAERLCHRLLRDAGIGGWRSNLPVRAGGRTYYLDVAFPEVGLVLEIDGRLHEDDVDVFENDRWRQNALVLEGWVVVRFTWTMLTRHPETVVETIRAALAATKDHGRPTGFRQSILARPSAHAQ